MSRVAPRKSSWSAPKDGVRISGALLLATAVYGCGDVTGAPSAGGAGEGSGPSSAGASAGRAPALGGGSFGGVSSGGAAGGATAEPSGGAIAEASSGGGGAPVTAAGASGAGMSGSGGGPAAHGAGCIDELWSTCLKLSDGALLQLTYQLTKVLDDATGEPLTNAVSVQDAIGAGCAALTDGTVKCWLLDGARLGAGQLGNGSTAAADPDTAFRAAPVVVDGGAPLSNVRAMAKGDFSPASCAVTNDGKLYCWGDLTWIAGGGTPTQTGSATQVTIDGASPLTGVIQVALGGRQACVLREGTSSHEVWCWGYGAEGELGQGDMSNQPFPAKVAGLTNPSAIAVAAHRLQGSEFIAATVCALDSGKVRCWGSNVEGATGGNASGTAVATATPVVDVGGAPLDGVLDLQPGFANFSALRADGSLWVWGSARRPYAASYATDVVAIAYGGEDGGFGPFYLTSDGAYHNGSQIVPIDCPLGP